MQKFAYPPLPSNGKIYIRLVRLYPGTFDEDVCITMRHEIFADKTADLSNSALGRRSDRPIYEAISYAWDKGDLRPAHISVRYAKECRDESPNAVVSDLTTAAPVDGWLPLGPNALSALRHFRFTDRPRDLWIDSMCIDQGDSIDKGRQVAMMGEIYARAKAVLVWLGEAAQDSDLAMTCMEDVGTQVRFEKSSRSILATPDCRDNSLLDRSIPVPFSVDEMRAVYHLLNRRWFERLWVRQEITLADQKTATIACGCKKMLWKTFYNVWGLLQRKAWPQQFELSNKLTFRLSNLRGFLYQSRYINLPNIRFNLGLAGCNDPRDRIYSVRALLPRNIQEHIKPDYTLPVPAIYRAATIAYMHEMKDVDFLSQCRLPNRLPCCPSWVPDWTDIRPILEEPWPLRFQIASGFLSTQYTEPKSDSLDVHGVFVAKVAAVTKPNIDGYFDVNWARIREVLRQEPRSLDDPCPGSSMTIGDAYTRVLCSNRFAENCFDPSTLHWPRYEVAKRRLSELHRATKSNNQDVSEALVYNRAKDATLLNRITSECLGRQLLWTEDDLLGLGSLDAQPGDHIWAVLGSRELLVLRPKSSEMKVSSLQDKTPIYQAGGGCTLFGHFEGEAVLGPVPNNIKIMKHRAGAMIFENTATGDQTLLDPRLNSLGVDLTALSAKLEKQQQENALDEPHPWLEITDIDYLRARLKHMGPKLQDLHIV
ncbi:hypothetical protein PFICI_06175 [Pestalotiopsis fici W106-1]|uniref:Heterokaryon incompatibility domain-containing protein n=1 Tax=Pestalotiopsis fici (strain W106-1 / CGMCC3.15140) TaxID=1229662 RepID=W3X4X4_PESFW|nr:uncharacterized protein PFICI_06175 [Pestalotiopsis fici W106-1]ETS81173.1 hypothetical protein PFICI_06175 [Pestalotiopsis fici W106-1]